MEILFSENELHALMEVLTYSSTSLEMLIDLRVNGRITPEEQERLELLLRSTRILRKKINDQLAMIGQPEKDMLN